MRRFVPYFKYLHKVRVSLIAGVLCGILYGAAGGLGIPLMIKYVIPRVLLPDAPPALNAGPAVKKAHFYDGWFHLPDLEPHCRSSHPFRAATTGRAGGGDPGG